jgi:hypothetical protein
MPVILAIQEAEIRRIKFEAGLGKQFTRPHLKKNPSQKRAGRVAQVVGLEFKSQYHTHTHTHTHTKDTLSLATVVPCTVLLN